MLVFDFPHLNMRMSSLLSKVAGGDNSTSLAVATQLHRAKLVREIHCGRVVEVDGYQLTLMMMNDTHTWAIVGYDDGLN